MARLMTFLGIILAALWMLGFFSLQIATPVIHTLIVLGVILVLLDQYSKRRIRW